MEDNQWNKDGETVKNAKKKRQEQKHFQQIDGRKDIWTEGLLYGQGDGWTKGRIFHL